MSWEDVFRQSGYEEHKKNIPEVVSLYERIYGLKRGREGLRGRFHFKPSDGEWERIDIVAIESELEPYDG